MTQPVQVASASDYVIGDRFDQDLVCSLYTTEFIEGGPGGVMCGQNDQNLRQAIARRQAFFQTIGFRRASLLHMEATPLVFEQLDKAVTN